MIKSLTVVNYLGKKLTVKLSEAFPSHGLLISSITGLGPSDAILNHSDYATNDGSEYNSSRLDKRPIQITFMLTANEHITVEEARHITYKYFPTKKEVKLIFETDTRTLYCTGRVEHNTPDVFNKQETATIDIVCGDPYFYKYSETGDAEVIEYELVSEAFSSEYLSPDDAEDETLRTFYTNEDDANLEMGVYNSTGIITQNIINGGDDNTGFILTIYFNGGIEGNIIISNSNNERILIKTSVIEEMVGSPLAAGDVITLSTNRKKRYLTLVKNGETINILNALDFTTLTWLELIPGDNLISYYVDNGNDYTSATFSFKNLYIGV